MYKNYFHNFKITIENNDKKKLHQVLSIENKKVVDINILLNKVKIEKRNEIKKIIIFYTLSILTLSFFAILLAKIK